MSFSTKIKTDWLILDDVHRTLQLGQRDFTTTPLEETYTIARAVQKTLSTLESSLTATADRSRFELLQDDCECLMIRIRIAESKQVKKRTYLKFESIDHSLRPSHPEHKKSLDELEALLEKHGLFEKLHIRRETENGVPVLIFPQTSDRALCMLSHQYPDLAPYFYDKKKNTCFEANEYISTKGLCEKRETIVHVETLQKKLLAEAAAYYLSLGTIKGEELPVPKDAIDVKSCLTEIFKTQKKQGLFLGELHRYPDSKKFLIEHMDLFKSMGVTTLFLENFPYDFLQPHLDGYLTSSSDEIPTLVQACFSYADYLSDASEPFTFLNLLKKAKAAGIRIVALDTNISIATGLDHATMQFGPERAQGMNYSAKQIIEHEKGDGHYLALIGNGHCWSKKKDDRFIPGLPALLNCPYININKTLVKPRPVRSIT